MEFIQCPALTQHSRKRLFGYTAGARRDCLLVDINDRRLQLLIDELDYGLGAAFLILAQQPSHLVRLRRLGPISRGVSLPLVSSRHGR